MLWISGILMIIIKKVSRDLQSPYYNEEHPTKKDLSVFLLMNLLCSLEAVPKLLLAFLEEDLELVTEFPYSLIYSFSTIGQSIVYTIVVPIFIFSTVPTYGNIFKRNMRELSPELELITLNE